MSRQYASYWNAFLSGRLLLPANEVWGKVIFLHLFVILFTGGHAWLLQMGACMVAPGGHAWLLWGGGGGHVWLLQGACVVAGGCAWLLGGMCGCSQGGMCGCSGGHAWLLQGGGWHVWLLWGACMVALGDMCGCCQGVCMAAPSGVCVVAPRGAFMGYDKIWRYGQ